MIQRQWGLMVPATLYKICAAADWQAAKRAEVFTGSPDDLRDGYIHFSTAEQLAGTLARHFAGQSGLMLLAVDMRRLGDGVRWEAARGGQLFPHLYGTLACAAVIREWTLACDEHGRHVLPEELG
jgi:uncharacterized protein (DUF952 family)